MDFDIPIYCRTPHPILKQPWDRPPTCVLKFGHDGPHEALWLGWGRENVAWCDGDFAEHH